MRYSIGLTNRITATHFQVQKPISGLLVSADLVGDEAAIVLLYNPERLFCGMISLGFGNFIPEIYISEEVCTLNGRDHSLLEGEYTIIILPVYDVKVKQREIVLNIAFDMDKTYEPQYCQGISKTEECDFYQVINPQHRYYKGDLHGHTIFSDGQNSIIEAAEILRQQDLEFMAFTEHNSLAFSVPEVSCLCIPSFELTVPIGHMNVHGVKGMDGLLSELMELEGYESLWEKTIDYVQGEANLSLNHMFMEPWHFTYDKFELSKLNTIEIMCDPTYPTATEANDKAVAFLDFLWEEGVQIYGIGGSDSHNKIEEYYEGASEPSVYGDPATYVYCKGLSVHHVLKGIKNGNAYVSRYMSLDVSICDGKYLPGNKIKDGDEIVYLVNVNSHQLELIGRFFLNGEVVKEVLLTPKDNEAFYVMKNSVDTWWLRFGVYDTKGHVLAYVNPIYNKEKKCENASFGLLKEKFLNGGT